MRKWTLRKVNGIWVLRHPCGYVQHRDYDAVVWRAWDLWEEIYKDRRRLG